MKKTHSNGYVLLVMILFQMMILYLFLYLFFRFYITKVQKQHFEDEMKSLVKQGIHKSFANLTPQENSATLTAIQTAKEPLEMLSQMYSGQSEKMQVNNKWVMNVGLIFFIFLLISFVLTFIVFNFICDKSIPLKTILIESGITFIFIGFIEYMFFKNIIMKYIPQLPSKLYQDIIAGINAQ